jgi:hypothetical protein
MQHTHSAFVVLLAVLLCTGVVAAAPQAPAGSPAQGGASTLVNLTPPRPRNSTPCLGSTRWQPASSIPQKNSGMKGGGS